MTVSKAQQKAVATYERKKYDKVLLRMPKGKKALIEQHASDAGESLNAFINHAIDEAIEKRESR